MVTAGKGRATYVVGAAFALAFAGACDAGSDASFDDPSGGTNAGMNATSGTSSVAGGGATNGGVTNNGGMATAGNANGGAATAGAAGVSGGGAGGNTAGNGGAAGSAGTSGNGGTAGSGGTAGGGNGGTAGTGGTSIIDGGEGGETNQGGVGGDATAGAGGDNDGMAGGGAGGEDSGPICDRVLLGSKPRASKVMLLMDRSGTMFEPPQTPAWPAVRDAALPVVDAYDALVDIGFMAMTGEANTCPLLDEVAPAAGNYAAISSKYQSLAKPTKGESPFMLALTRAKQLLDAAPAGDAYVIFVTDGFPDYCDDGNDICAVDSVVNQMQLLRSAGVTTLIGALPIYQGANADRYAKTVQTYANAGAGLPAASVTDFPADTYNQCNPFSAAWTAEFTASAKPAMSALASYSASPGAATYESLSSSDSAALGAAFGRLFARTLSCKLDISNGSKIDSAQAAQGVVKVDGQAIAYDQNNGWRLNSPSEIELVGTACSAWRTGASTKSVSLDFPCSAITH